MREVQTDSNLSLKLARAKILRGISGLLIALPQTLSAAMPNRPSGPQVQSDVPSLGSPSRGSQGPSSPSPSFGGSVGSGGSSQAPQAPSRDNQPDRSDSPSPPSQPSNSGGTSSGNSRSSAGSSRSQTDNGMNAPTTSAPESSRPDHNHTAPNARDGQSDDNQPSTPSRPDRLHRDSPQQPSRDSSANEPGPENSPQAPDRDNSNQDESSAGQGQAESSDKGQGSDQGGQGSPGADEQAQNTPDVSEVSPLEELQMGGGGDGVYFSERFQTPDRDGKTPGWRESWRRLSDPSGLREPNPRNRRFVFVDHEMAAAGFPPERLTVDQAQAHNLVPTLAGEAAVRAQLRAQDRRHGLAVYAPSGPVVRVWADGRPSQVVTQYPGGVAFIIEQSIPQKALTPLASGIEGAIEMLENFDLSPEELEQRDHRFWFRDIETGEVFEYNSQDLSIRKIDPNSIPHPFGIDVLIIQGPSEPMVNLSPWQRPGSEALLHKASEVFLEPLTPYPQPPEEFAGLEPELRGFYLENFPVLPELAPEGSAVNFSRLLSNEEVEGLFAKARDAQAGLPLAAFSPQESAWASIVALKIPEDWIQSILPGLPAEHPTAQKRDRLATTATGLAQELLSLSQGFPKRQSYLLLNVPVSQLLGRGSNAVTVPNGFGQSYPQYATTQIFDQNSIEHLNTLVHESLHTNLKHIESELNRQQKVQSQNPTTAPNPNLDAVKAALEFVQTYVPESLRQALEQAGRDPADPRANQYVRTSEEFLTNTLSTFALAEAARNREPGQKTAEDLELEQELVDEAGKWREILKRAVTQRGFFILNEQLLSDSEIDQMIEQTLNDHTLKDALETLNQYIQEVQ